jgi:hypothetical protein
MCREHFTKKKMRSGEVMSKDIDLDSELFDDSPMGDFGFGGDMTVEVARKLHAIFTAPTAAEAYSVVSDGQSSLDMLRECSTTVPDEGEEKDQT